MIYLNVVVWSRDKMKCKMCGADKIIYIDGSWVCDTCEVGGIHHEKKG